MHGHRRRRATAWLIAWLWLVLVPWPVGAGTGPPGTGPAKPDAVAPGKLPTRLVMPTIQLDAAIEPMGLHETGKGYEWIAPDKNVGWHDTSTLPGETGNLVLSGHNASLGGRIFRNLYHAKIGDRFTILTGDRSFEYEIVERHVLRDLFTSRAVRLANARWIGEFPDERVTLVTCHPTWTNTHRLVLVARPIATREQALAVERALAQVRRETGLTQLQVSVPPFEIAAQTRPDDQMTFDAALDLAVRSLMIEGEAQLKQPGVLLTLLKQGEQGPRGETVADHWIFRLDVPDTQGHRWTVVRRATTGVMHSYRTP